VLANGSNLNTPDPILIYTALALYGLLTALLIAYVYAKFREASRALKVLQTEWQKAENTHNSFVGIAKEQLSRLNAPSSSAPAAGHLAPHSGIGTIGQEVRHQIVAMAKRGRTAGDIARTCGLQEGEVDVILGMARLLR